MFVFKIWGKFASFRDPFTISQNISLSIPAKSTVAGMMASILGMEDYIKDKDFDFKYSIVTINPIQKKSFSQNYINDYTKKTLTQLNNIKKRDFEKIARGLRDSKNPQKPINRELIINPKYLIFIKDFIYKEQIVKNLQSRISKFPLYLGNSEFAGNFEYVKIENFSLSEKSLVKVDSFVSEEDLANIVFEDSVRYSTLTFSSKLDNKRTPIKMDSIVIANSKIKLKNIKNIYKVQTSDKEYFCRFI